MTHNGRCRPLNAPLAPRSKKHPKPGRARHWFGNFILLFLLTNSSLHAQAQPPKNDPHLNTVPAWPYRIAQSAPHNTEHFTQGLIVETDSVIESSGLYGQSFVQKYSRESGAQEARYTLPKQLFAEGIARYGQQLYLLTWKSGRGFVLNTQDLRPLREFRYQGEGWGLTRVGQQLLMSNGTAVLTWYRPNDFKLLNKTIVQAGQHPIGNLNALTYGGGYLWANVWRQATILAISPKTGQIEGQLKLEKLWQQEASGSKENVLNGLSWDESEQALWVTGKRWQRRYLLRITPAHAAGQKAALK